MAILPFNFVCVVILLLPHCARILLSSYGNEAGAKRVWRFEASIEAMLTSESLVWQWPMRFEIKDNSWQAMARKRVSCNR
jgi:hypothetical protein